MPIKQSGAIAGGWQRHHTIVRVAKGQNMVHDYSSSQTNRANKPREGSTTCLRRRSELAQSGFWHCYDPGYDLGVTLEAMENIMRSLLKLTTAAALLAATSVASHAAIKEISYPAIKVELTPVHTPDAAFEKMRRELLDVIAKKDAKALSTFVGSTFVWLSGGGVSGQFDFGRDALHNFKVVFGLREAGQDADLPTVEDAVWESLEAFANDRTYYAADHTARHTGRHTLTARVRSWRITFCFDSLARPALSPRMLPSYAGHAGETARRMNLCRGL